MPPTNPELEAAIAADPDDDDAYFVYGDWLQTKGDPRGELIALQASALRDPSDDKLSKSVDRFLKDHADELLGPLGAAKKQLTVVWHLGFIRDAVITTASMDLLRALLEHPSGRFLQSISIANGVMPKEVVELLLAEKRPKTLAELRVGRDFDPQRDAPELSAHFPRLAHSVDADWRRIADFVAEQRKVNIYYDASNLPRLFVKPGGEPPGIDNHQLLLAMRLELDKKKPLGVIAAMKRSFTADSIDRFVVALAEQWSQLGEKSTLRWAFDALGPLGGDDAAAWIADRLGGWSHQRAVQGVHLLDAMRSGVAVWEIFAMVSDPRMMDARRRDAREILEGMAAVRKIDVDQLLDRSLPPSTNRGKRIADAIERRIFNLAIDGRRVSPAIFNHYYVNHPLVAPLARRTLWATYERGVVETTFRIDEEGKARNAGGGDVDLIGASIGAVHPAEIAEDERRGVYKEWKEVFDDEGVKTVFPLDRPVEKLRDTDEGSELTRFKLRTVGFDHLRETFENEFDWVVERDPETDGGPTTLGWGRHFRRDNVDVFASIGGNSGSIESVTARRRGAGAVAFAKLHPVTISEILYAVDRATTREKVELAEVGGIEKGTRVRVTSGADRGTEGVVFWLGEGNRGERCGLRTDEDVTVWADIANVNVVAPKAAKAAKVVATTAKVADEEGAAPSTKRKLVEVKPAKAAAKPKAAAAKVAEPAADDDDDAPKITKGMKVRWRSSRHEGTGVAFWLGKNKFGDGMRVGVKDDETGETVWADADDCQPV